MLAAACRVHVKLARLPAWFAKRASGALRNLPTIIFPNFTFSIFKNVPRASQFNSKLKASLTWRALAVRVGGKDERCSKTKDAGTVGFKNGGYLPGTRDSKPQADPALPNSIPKPSFLTKNPPNGHHAGAERLTRFLPRPLLHYFLVRCDLGFTQAATAAVEDTFKRINSHKGVEGIIVISNDGIPIRTTLEPEITVQYAALVTRFTEKSKSVLTQLNGEVRPFFSWLNGTRFCERE